MKNRIPRKKKKVFKKLWSNNVAYKFVIIKSTIDKSKWNCSEGNNVWGCQIRPKDQYKFVYLNPEE